MYLLSVNLYEFGQFLQILLWIFLPMVLIALLITTWLHYRKKRTTAYSHPSEQFSDPSVHFSEDISRHSEDSSSRSEDRPLPSENLSRPSGDRLASGLFIGEPTAVLPEESGNAYRGLLWMKDKYEQYREHTDRKFEKLKEDLARAEEKYLDLLAARSPLPQSITIQEASRIEEFPALEEITADQEILLHEKDQQIGLLHIELEERIKNYHELKDLLSQEKEKTADLTAKLECNIHLLRRIHQEMDRSLKGEESGAALSPPIPEVSKIVGWI